MDYENGQWIIYGASEDCKNKIESFEQLIEYVNKTGFLPLFKNEIEGFSVEEHAPADFWWTGIEQTDPWEWRVLAARSGKVAYGKFFGKKAGFISLEWFPYFVNHRRNGYDFDSLCDEGLAGRRAMNIMELFSQKERLFSYEIKREAGFGKGGEKNFSGTITDLQMQTYLVMTDFCCRKNKKGEEYGMPVTLYAKPEDIWGYDAVTSAYSEEPSDSAKRILDRMKQLYLDSEEKAVRKLCL